MTKKVRIGIVGLGGIAHGQHIPSYLKCPDCEIMAICDVSEQQLQVVGDRLGVSTPDRLSGAAGPGRRGHAVSVATYPNTHHPVSMAALAAGKHILCEKPLALNATLGREMLQAAHDAPHLQTAVGFTHRATPAVRLAQRLIRSGATGEILHIVAVYSMGPGDLSSGPMMYHGNKRRSGGGPLFEMGPHMVDMIRWCTGEELTAVCSQMRTFTKQRPWPNGDMHTIDTEDHATFMADLSGGGTIHCETSFVVTGRSFDQRLEVYGTEGALLYDQGQPYELRACIGTQMATLCAGHGIYSPGYNMFRREEVYPVIPVPGDLMADAVADPDWPARRASGFGAEFVAAIQGNRPEILPSFYEGAKSQDVLDAVVLSSAERRWVDVPQDL